MSSCLRFLLLLIPAVLAYPTAASAERCAGPTTDERCEQVRPGMTIPKAIALPDKATLSPAAKKVAPALREAADAVLAYRQRATAVKDLRELSTEAVRVDGAGEIQVYVILAQFQPEYLAQLEAAGLRSELSLPEHRLVQGWLAADRVDVVAAFDFVVEVKPPGYPVPRAGAELTAGDAILQASTARAAYGVTGAGIKVGVISDGADHIAQSVATGDLPSGISVLKNPGGDEGTAMLEIVHDLAPGADLAFYGPTTSADMVNGISALAAAGARIVVDDLIFLDEPKFQDGMIAQSARNFATGGKLYVSAAGNEARSHYRATYNRLTGQNFPNASYAAVHNFASGSGTDIGNSFSLPNNCNIRVVLQWNNPSGASTDDFDLFLGRSGTLAVLASSTGAQSGTQNAFEYVGYTNTTGAAINVFIAIAEWKLSSAPASLILDYFVYERCGIGASNAFEYAMSADSIIGHSAVSEVLSVAAVSANSPTTVEPYSSRGPGSVSFPAPQARSVPNISAVDCVATEVGAAGYFAYPFCGTSAAAPHVAGVAALLMERNPGMSSTQLRDLITGHAADLGAAGYDTSFGYGRADASATLAAASAAPATSLAPGTTLIASATGAAPTIVSTLSALCPAAGAVLVSASGESTALSTAAGTAFIGIAYSIARDSFATDNSNVVQSSALATFDGDANRDFLTVRRVDSCTPGTTSTYRLTAYRTSAATSAASFVWNGRLTAGVPLSAPGTGLAPATTLVATAANATPTIVSTLPVTCPAAGAVLLTGAGESTALSNAAGSFIGLAYSIARDSLATDNTNVVQSSALAMFNGDANRDFLHVERIDACTPGVTSTYRLTAYATTPQTSAASFVWNAVLTASVPVSSPGAGFAAGTALIGSASAAAPTIVTTLPVACPASGAILVTGSGESAAKSNAAGTAFIGLAYSIARDGFATDNGNVVQSSALATFNGDTNRDFINVERVDTCTPGAMATYRLTAYTTTPQTSAASFVWNGRLTAVALP